MFFSVSAKGDASNIDGGITGPIPEWRLVPHDNNIAQRNVHPVSPRLSEVIWEKLPFWIRNRGLSRVRLGVDIKLPEWLGKLGWKFSVPQITKETFLKPDDMLRVNLAVSKGKAIDDAVLAKQADHDIVLTVLHDGMPVGGMTFQISKDAKQAFNGSGTGGTRTTAKVASARKAVKHKTVRSKKAK